MNPAQMPSLDKKMKGVEEDPRKSEFCSICTGLTMVFILTTLLKKTRGDYHHRSSIILFT